MPHKILFLFFLIGLKVQGQEKDSTITFPYSLTSDKVELEINIDNVNPNTHKDFLFTITLMDFRAADGAASGPFILEPILQYYNANRNMIGNTRFFWTPISQKLLEDENGKYNFQKVEFEFYGNIVFHQKTKLVNKRLIVHYRDNGNVKEYFFINGKWPSVNQYNFRIGSLFRQGTLTSKYKTNINNEDILFNFDGYRQIISSVGISRIKKMHINFNSNLRGNVNIYKIGEIYSDFLIAPINNFYGQVYNNDILSSSGEIKSNIDKLEYGFRIGATIKQSQATNKNMGLFMGTEASFYPGFSGSKRFELVFLKMGLVF